MLRGGGASPVGAAAPRAAQQINSPLSHPPPNLPQGWGTRANRDGCFTIPTECETLVRGQLAHLMCSSSHASCVVCAGICERVAGAPAGVVPLADLEVQPALATQLCVPPLCSISLASQLPSTHRCATTQAASGTTASSSCTTWPPPVPRQVD